MRVLLKFAQHAIIDDIDVGKNAGFLAVNARILKMQKVPRTRRTGVYHRRDTRAKRMSISNHTQTFRRTFRGSSVVNMYMDVNQAGCDITPAHIHHFSGECWVNVGLDCGNDIATYCHIHLAINVIFGVNNMPVFD